MSAARRRRTALRLAALCGAILANVGTGATPADTPAAKPVAKPVDAFDRAFATRGEPVSLHYEVEYLDAKGPHTLSVWRDRDVHLRRSTDGVLDLLVERGADDELQMSIVDHRKRIATAVSRTALYKVGHGLDWFSLAHGLARPIAAYTTTTLNRAPVDVKPIEACRWMALTQGERHSDICWSTRLGLPLLIVAQPSGKTVWRVVASQAGPIEASAFSIAAPGYVRVNADDDIQAD